ncbi:hypothetical protein [Streptomyces sp. ISL-43]|uniref:hypothetical protein n=1 Tax=Streptomyces sp. ISL-43 TaxID=2819183 RepID=UPI00203641E8|nr:hypothetical protein [Streptomyces sp. ISL-43]
MQRQPASTDDDTIPIPRIHGHSPSAPEPDSRAWAAPSPVFVDSSGIRQRRVRRLGWLLVVPAAGYVVLLVSSLFGGPTLSSPFLPLPHTPPVPNAAQSKAPPAAATTASTAPPKRDGTAASGAAQAPATPSAASPTRGNTIGTTTPTATRPAPSPGNGATPAPGPTNHGRSSSAPGQVGKPTTHP